MTDRRDRVPFDPRHFEKLAANGIEMSARETFRRIHETNHWAAPGSVSGLGAESGQLRRLRVLLPKLLAELGIDSLLDAPCGDFAALRDVDLPVSRYLGGDIVPELIERNRALHGAPGRSFQVLDLTADPLPRADLLFCRDCLVHLSFADIARVLANIRRSEIPLLLTTTFPACDENADIRTGDWRVLNLEKSPFGWPPPERLINEGNTEGGGVFRDKSLGLWRVESLTDFGGL